MTPTEHTLNIRITADVASNTTGPLEESQVAFSVDQPTIKLPSVGRGGQPIHVINFNVSGHFNDGVEIEHRFCNLYVPDGIRWYSPAFEEGKNAYLNQGQRVALERWLANNVPVVAPDGRSATVTINRASMQGILNEGQTLVLDFGIHLHIARNGPSPWLEIHHDPEVDIEMDA